MSKTDYTKELSIQGVFGIPNDIKYTDEDLRIVMNHSIHKFHAVAGQIPELPEEFALVLAAIDFSTNQTETVMAAWMQATAEDAFISNLDQEIKAYDLKVIEYLTPDQFVESKVLHPYTNNKVTTSIKVKIEI